MGWLCGLRCARGSCLQRMAWLGFLWVSVGMVQLKLPETLSSEETNYLSVISGMTDVQGFLSVIIFKFSILFQFPLIINTSLDLVEAIFQALLSLVSTNYLQETSCRTPVLLKCLSVSIRQVLGYISNLNVPSCCRR